MELFSTEEAHDLVRANPLVDADEIPSWLLLFPQFYQQSSFLTSLAVLATAAVIAAMIRLTRNLELKVNVSARKTVDVNNLATFASRSKLVEILQRFGARTSRAQHQPPSKPNKKTLRWHSSVRD